MPAIPQLWIEPTQYRHDLVHRARVFVQGRDEAGFLTVLASRYCDGLADVERTVARYAAKWGIPNDGALQRRLDAFRDWFGEVAA